MATDASKPQSAPQQTVSSNGVWSMWDAQADLTTVYVPCVDENGRRYVREIVVRGDNVLDHGRDQA